MYEVEREAYTGLRFLYPFPVTVSDKGKKADDYFGAGKVWVRKK